LSNLDPLTVEDSVWGSLQAVTPIFVKNVIVIIIIIAALLLSNLDPLTVEDSVWESLQAVTPIFVKNVNIGRDALTGMSRL
jgi:hypothetical protein